MDGNLTVLVTGERFDDFGDPKCRFGHTEVPAAFIHRGALTCVAPPARALCERTCTRCTTPLDYCRSTGGAPTPMSIAVEVSFNGVDFTRRSDAIFTYYNLSDVLLTSMHPTGGPADGGTVVNITGLRLVDHGGGTRGARCHFGTAPDAPLVNATITEDRRWLACRAPPLRRGPSVGAGGDGGGGGGGSGDGDAFLHVPVFVTLSGYADERTLADRADLTDPILALEGSALRFRYVRTPLSLHGAAPLGGPAAGGSRVVITAARGNFSNDGAPRCLFGGGSEHAADDAGDDDGSGAGSSGGGTQTSSWRAAPVEVPASIRGGGRELVCRSPERPPRRRRDGGARDGIAILSLHRRRRRGCRPNPALCPRVGRND